MHLRSSCQAHRASPNPALRSHCRRPCRPERTSARFGHFLCAALTSAPLRPPQPGGISSLGDPSPAAYFCLSILFWLLLQFLPELPDLSLKFFISDQHALCFLQRTVNQFHLESLDPYGMRSIVLVQRLWLS